MAVSNSIGSNVFDILIGLGLPWALQTLAVDYGSYVSAFLHNFLNSDKQTFSVALVTELLSPSIGGMKILMLQGKQILLVQIFKVTHV